MCVIFVCGFCTQATGFWSSEGLIVAPLSFTCCWKYYQMKFEANDSWQAQNDPELPSNIWLALLQYIDA